MSEIPPIVLWLPPLVLVAGVAGFAVFLFLFQDRLVYSSTGLLTRDPSSIGLVFEELWLCAADGIRLNAWFIPAPRPRACLLFFHGNHGNLSGRMDSLALFHKLGFDTLILDYRGFGRSEGHPGEEGIGLDADAAWDHLVRVRGIPPDQIAVFGRSLGGVPAAAIAALHTPGCLVLESTFTSLLDLVQRLYPYLPMGLLFRNRSNNLKQIGAIRCPLLIAHSRDDRLVPYAMGRTLYEAAGAKRQFFEMEGEHNNRAYRATLAYQEGLEKFFSSVFPIPDQTTPSR
ncbi:MAG: alpha/beta fold hydrolase [Planctomycetes bacterium]|nr:alpha/beta fold hydrolase [Planctomycetota bacterium]